MDTVIIGIHGLRNKPPKYLLMSWWKKAMMEGLKAARAGRRRVRFDMAYWAHYMHERPQQGGVADEADPRILREPYVAGGGAAAGASRGARHGFSEALHRQIVHIVAGKNGFMNVDAISDIILHRMFVELDIYYRKNLPDGSGGRLPAKALIRGELARLLQKYRRKQILLVAHSMGAIVAYDTLLHVVPDIPVHTLITMGAPLGFPVIMRRIREDLGLARSHRLPLPTPPGIRHHWLNFSDIDDCTCLNYDLHTHYGENACGVSPRDQIVFNDYEYNDRRNPHKAYGYLRTPQYAEALHHFLDLDTAGFWRRLTWLWKRPEF